MGKKLPKNTDKVMRTLVIHNGSEYTKKIEDHVKSAGTGKSTETKRLTPDEVQSMYKKDNDFLNKFDYIVSTGSPNYSKKDTEFHADLKQRLESSDATFLGVCHGAQQYAVAHGAELKKGDEMHQGTRESKVVKYNDSLKGAEGEGKIKQYGHHKWFVPNNGQASNLEVIAEGETKSGEKFVEMYKVKGKEHYGVQFHPEKGDGHIIKNLFNKAYEKKTGQNKPEYQKAESYKKAASYSLLILIV